MSADPKRPEFEPQPYPTRDPWEGTDEEDGTAGDDCCHHGVGFDERCGKCEAEEEFDER